MKNYATILWDPRLRMGKGIHVQDFFQATVHGELGRGFLDMLLMSSPLTAAEKKKLAAPFLKRYPALVKEYPWEVEVFIPYSWFNRQYRGGDLPTDESLEIKDWNYYGGGTAAESDEHLSDRFATFGNGLLPVRTLLDALSPAGLTDHPKWFHSQQAAKQARASGKALRWRREDHLRDTDKPPASVFTGIALTPWEFGLATIPSWRWPRWSPAVRSRLHSIETFGEYNYAGFTFFWMFPTKKTAEAYKRKIDKVFGRDTARNIVKDAKPKARVHKITSFPYGNTDIGFSRRAWLPGVDTNANTVNLWLQEAELRESYPGGRRKIKRTKTSSTRKTDMSKKKKLTKTELNREAKKYHKSRAKKRWWTLLKKYGMKNARLIVHLSHKIDAAAQYGTKVPKSGKKKVPEHMTKTARKKAEGTYVFSKRKSYPIGDLFHARMAVLRAQWPSNLKNAGKVLRAVVRRWPKYNWAAYWNKEAKEAKNSRSIKTYAKTIKQR